MLVARMEPELVSNGLQWISADFNRISHNYS